MPYKVVKLKDKFGVKNTETGEMKSTTPISKEEAENWMKKLYSVEDKKSKNESFDMMVNRYLGNFIFEDQTTQPTTGAPTPADVKKATELKQKKIKDAQLASGKITPKLVKDAEDAGLIDKTA